MRNEKLKEGIDFYFDQWGLMIFMEEYLLKRGSCCGHGCRHCPYEYENVMDREKRRFLLSQDKRKEQ